MKTKLMLLAIIAITGCTAMPSVELDANGCRAIEGSYGKQVRGSTKMAYKYLCDGRAVWMVAK